MTGILYDPCENGWRFGSGAGLCVLAGMLFLGSVAPAAGLNANGNDFALYYTEAPDEPARRVLLEDAGRRPHFFRYLQIVEMERQTNSGRTSVRIRAWEPASALDVVFTLNQRVSLSKLEDEPTSGPGTAVAVSGVIRGVDLKTGTLFLDPAVLRHKDRTAPVAGKEMLYELDPDGRFYSFMGGRQAISVTFRDRDLLRHRDRIMEEGGDQAWADFLEKELKQRRAARAAGDAAP